jgi:hypothetical protein
MHSWKIEADAIPQVLINSRPFILYFESFKTTHKNEAKLKVTKKSH